MSSLARTSAPTPFGPADLVGRERQQIGAQHGDVAIDTARRLHGIDMEQTARRMNDRRGFRHRLNDAGFVVGEHQRNQRPRRFGNGFGERRQIEPTLRIDRQFLDCLAGKASARAHRDVLDGREQKFRSRKLVAGDLDCRRQRQHIGFGAARGKKHVTGACPDQCRDLFARLLDQTPRGAALGVHRGRIAGDRKRLGKGRPGLIAQRRRGVPIEIAALRHAGYACFLAPGLC